MYSDLFLAANRAALTNPFWYLSVAVSFVKWRIQSLGHTVLVFLLHQVGHFKLPSNIFPARRNISTTLCILWCSFLLRIFQMLLPEKGRFDGILFGFFLVDFMEKSQHHGKQRITYWYEFFSIFLICIFTWKSILCPCRSHHLGLTVQSFISGRIQATSQCQCSLSRAVGCMHTGMLATGEINPWFLFIYLSTYF